MDFHVVGDGPVLFDGARLPFADGAFDVCLLAFVLSYTDDPAALLREAERVASRRVLILQSSPRGRAGWVALRLRGWAQGRLAFRLCATLRLIPPSPSPLRRRRLLSRERVGELADEVGLRPARVVPEPGLPGLVSRDLFVLEGPPRGPAPTPRSGRNAHEAAPTPDLGNHPREERGGADQRDRGVGPPARDRYREARRDGGAVEVIVVDNASDDGTADALARHAAAGDVLVSTCAPRRGEGAEPRGAAGERPDAGLPGRRHPTAGRGACPDRGFGRRARIRGGDHATRCAGRRPAGPLLVGLLERREGVR